MIKVDLARIRILLVIFIVTFFSLIFFSSYSYFAASTSNSANVNVNMNKLPSAMGTCSSSGSSTASADAFTASNMQQHNVSASTDVVHKCTGNVVVTASPPNTSTKITCTYNLTWAWTNSGGYTKSSSLGTNMEFTYKLQSYDGAAWSNVIGETQFPTAANTNPATIKSGVSLVGDGADATATYRMCIYFYNVNVNQDGHKGKTYTGKFSTSGLAATLATK